jgi:hypothetical protein
MVSSAAGRLRRAVVDLKRHRRHRRRPPFGIGQPSPSTTVLRHFHCSNRDRTPVALAPGNLIALVVNAQVLNGIITPLLLTYVLIPGQQIQRARLSEERAGVQDDRHDL